MAYEKLQEVTRKKGLSTLQLAMDSKISPSSLYAALNDKIPFYPGWKSRVADTLGEPIEMLFPEVENNASEND